MLSIKAFKIIIKLISCILYKIILIHKPTKNNICTWLALVQKGNIIMDNYYFNYCSFQFSTKNLYSKLLANLF